MTRRWRHFHNRLAVLGLLTLAVPGLPQAAAQAAAQSDEPEANPARPTVATPATLTPVAYLQFESGILAAWNSPEFSSRTGTNEVVKLAVARRLQFVISAEPMVWFRAEGARGHDPGDVFVGAQAVVLSGEAAKPTVALSYLRQVRDGGLPDIDIGSAPDSVLLLASADVQGFHYDANAIFNRQREQRVSRAQFGQTISISHTLRGRLGITGELWHFTQPFLRGNTVGNLWALNYNARKNLVFDAGFNHGFTSTATRWELFAGFTYLLPHRLWH